MSDINMANRQCCDLDIRTYSTNKPWMFADFCNTTTAGFSSDSVYAMKKGAKAIAFSNPIDATMSISYQCHPFKIYAMLSDGELETSAIIAERKDIASTVAGELSITDTPIAGSVYVYAQGDFGGTPIEGSFATGKFTATTPANIVMGTTYTVAYLVSKTTGVSKVSFNNSKLPKAFRITQETLDKDENDNLVPVKMTAYKAVPQRKMDWSWSSTGDPAELTITFDCLEDADGNVLDMVEITA